MKLCPGCHNPFASGKLYKCLQRLLNEDESSNAAIISLEWRGWKLLGSGIMKAPCSNFTHHQKWAAESNALSLLLKNKRTPAATQKKQITHTQREKSSSVKITGICTRGKIRFAVKRGPRANLECEASTPFT